MEITRTSSPEDGNYRSILKSTSLVGGASIINILIGMVRTKFVAILIGPAGVGLLGTYIQIIGLVGSVTGMGIGNSGVRQVAEAVGSNDDVRIARIVITLRRTAWLSGGLGLLVMVSFCLPMSRMTFGSDEYAWPIAVLGVTLLTGSIASGQGCIINGTRRIGDLARISVIGAINGTLISIPCFYLWGQAGIVPSLILSAFATLATSWWFARRVPVKRVALTFKNSCVEARQLLSLGASFMGAGLVTMLSGYLIRIVILRQFSLADVGIYQAALSLSGILVGFVLGAMGADYYPRLTAVASDNACVRRMVNEQSQISVLLSLPGLAAMMIFAPTIIRLFYAASFTKAVPILHWCILGILGQVFSWPLGFVMLAKAKGKLFLFTDIIAYGVQLLGVIVFIRLWGLRGAGIAFTAMYVVYTGLMLIVIRRLIGAVWNRHTFFLIIFASIAMAFLMLNCTFNNDFIFLWTINLTILFAVSMFCIRQLSQRSGIGINNLLARIGIKKSF
jgi:PST family polysaccharide transporter